MLGPLKESLEYQAQEAEIYPTGITLSKTLLIHVLNKGYLGILIWQVYYGPERKEPSTVQTRGGGRVRVDQGRIRDGSEVSSLGD